MLILLFKIIERNKIFLNLEFKPEPNVLINKKSPILEYNFVVSISFRLSIKKLLFCKIFDNSGDNKFSSIYF